MIGTNRAAAILLIGGLAIVAGCERRSEAEPTPTAQIDEKKALEPWESVDDAFKGCELG
jgi:hypothetical protein